MRVPIEQQQKPKDKADEVVIVTGNGPIKDVQLSATDGTPVVRGRAAPEEDPKAPQVPEPTLWRVLKGGHVTQNGHRALIREGKEISSLNYDIRDLQRQGIRLRKIEPGDAPIEDD